MNTSHAPVSTTDDYSRAFTAGDYAHATTAFVFLPPLIGELSKLGDSLPSLTQSVIELLNNNVGGLTSPDLS